MTGESKTTQVLLRALVKEMEKTLAKPKSKDVDLDNYKTVVNVEEFERGESEGSWWDDDGSADGADPLGFDLRPKPTLKARGKYRPRGL